MKQNIFYTGVLTLSLMMFYGCSNETGDDPKVNPRGEEKEVQVLFKSAINNDTKADFGTRAGEIETATDLEKDFDRSKIMLYVYDENGNLEFQEENITLPPDPDNSYTITITTGTKYFYAFANTGNFSVTAKQSRGEFERQILDVVIEEDEALHKSLPTTAGNGTDRKFFLGTLWGVQTKIDAGVDYVNTKPITLDIGRNIGKVKLHGVLLREDPSDTYSVLKGELGPDKEYRIGAVPQKSYLVGQYTGKTYPGSPTDEYSTVTSAVHTEGPGEENKPNTIFTSYPFKPVSELPTGNDPLTDYFYLVENTTAIDDKGLQYFNNTTHIRLKTKYIPDPSEVWDDELTASGAQLEASGTFWTVIKDNQRYITNATPITSTPGVDPLSIKKYENGLQYHLIPIQNPNLDFAKKPELKNAVLRNHYYEIKILGIRDLGYAVDDEGEIIPIPVEQDVKVIIEVKDWSKITHNPKI